MATLRLIKPHEPAVPSATGLESQQGEFPQESTWTDGSARRGDTRIRLDSLPTPLRAAVREQSEQSVTIEAELPWLSIGTALHVDSADGTERSGCVRSFDVEVTSAGSARLLIFATTGPSSAPAGERPKKPRRSANRRRTSLLIAALVVAAAIIVAFLAGQQSARRDSAVWPAREHEVSPLPARAEAVPAQNSPMEAAPPALPVASSSDTVLPSANAAPSTEPPRRVPSRLRHKRKK
jgi:hypothetical protein